MGDIVFLAHRLPYPPDRGDRIRSWHVLKALAGLGRVHVAALIDGVADHAHVAMVERVAASVAVATRDPSRVRAVLRAVARGTPASVEAFRSAALARLIEQLLYTHEVDCIYAFSGQMAAYVPESFRGRFVMDFVDMDSAKFAARGGAYRLEARRLLAWERAAAMRADASLFVSADEAALFRAATGLLAQVLENGIDLDRFAPRAAERGQTCSIVFTGQMDYAPNVEAVRRFVKDALPRIQGVMPDVRFAIVGRAPTAQVRALASARVIVTGEVADTRPWLAAADVVVAPLAIARGVQNKVLEAMAMARPVVASIGAARGIDAFDGRDLIATDDPAPAVIALLRDPVRAAAMGEAARARMIARYGWDAQLAPLAGIVGR